MMIPSRPLSEIGSTGCTEIVWQNLKALLTCSECGVDDGSRDVLAAYIPAAPLLADQQESEKFHLEHMSRYYDDLSKSRLDL